MCFRECNKSHIDSENILNSIFFAKFGHILVETVREPLSEFVSIADRCVSRRARFNQGGAVRAGRCDGPAAIPHLERSGRGLVRE